MPVSEAQKRARNKYDKENMDRVTIKVKKELLQSFRQAVQDNGQQVNTVFREFMEEYIKENTSSDLWKESPAWDLDNPNVRSYIRQELEKNK